MINLSLASLVRTVLAIVGLSLLLMVLQFQPVEVLGLFKNPPVNSPKNGWLAFAALRKYCIVSGLVVFTMNILVLLRTLTSPHEFGPGMASAIIGVLFGLFLAYPICGLLMRRQNKKPHYPRFAFGIGFRNDRCTLYLLLSTGMIFILMVVIIMMMVLRIQLVWP